MTALHNAVRAGDVKAIATLLGEGADVDALDKQGDTPLDYAVSRGHTEVVAVLRKAMEDAAADDEQDPMCFMAGTEIATPTGMCLVEDFAIGDPVLTASGEVMAVKWIGRQSYFIRAYPVTHASSPSASVPARWATVCPIAT